VGIGYWVLGIGYWVLGIGYWRAWCVVRGAFLAERIGCDEANLVVNAIRNSAT
jgi:hypothetical protein